MRFGALTDAVSVSASWVQARLNTIIGSRRAALVVDNVMGPATISSLMYYVGAILGADPVTGRLFDGRIYQFEAVTGSSSVMLTTPLKTALAGSVGADGSVPRTPAPSPPPAPMPAPEDIPIEYGGRSSSSAVLAAVAVVGVVWWLSRNKTSTRRGLRGLRGLSKLTVERVPLNRGGYTKRGVYYGQGKPLYRWDDAGDGGMLRADNRKDALDKAQIRRAHRGGRP